MLLPVKLSLRVNSEAISWLWLWLPSRHPLHDYWTCGTGYQLWLCSHCYARTNTMYKVTKQTNWQEKWAFWAQRIAAQCPKYSLNKSYFESSGRNSSLFDCNCEKMWSHFSEDGTQGIARSSTSKFSLLKIGKHSHNTKRAYSSSLVPRPSRGGE